MSIYCVEYVYDDQDARRDEVRPEHRSFLAGLMERGALLASGPWVAGPAPDATGAAPGALLVLRGDGPQEVLATLDDDPFRRAGLVARRTIREWNPVLGPWT